MKVPAVNERWTIWGGGVTLIPILKHTMVNVKVKLSLCLTWPGCEADHSPLSSTEFKNAWSYSSTPP